MIDEDRSGTIARAFHLIHDVQAGLAGSDEALEALATLARQEGWDDVERVCLFGEAVSSWMREDGQAARAVGALVERSSKAGDDVMLALGLALRSDQGFSDGDLSGATVHDEDLARAVVLLEPARGRPCERISAHTACAIALGNRWLFELSHEQYEAALAIGAAEPEGTLDFLLAPIRFNLAEQQVSWASKLFELGDDAGVRARLASWNDALTGTRAYAMSESWQLELDALSLVLHALAGHEVAADAARLTATLTGSGATDARATGLLRLAVAVGRARNPPDPPTAEDAAAVSEAVRAVSPTVHPLLYDLALFLAARLEARPGADAGLRYARRVVTEQWTKREGALMAMRAQIGSVRLASERDLFSRLARLDDLTGIANRWALEEFLRDLVHRGVEQCALLLFDVDSFKAVNDLHGHLAGDRLLVRIAEVLTEGIRGSDLAVRLGGDEFAVILAGAGAGAARQRAEALVQAFDQEPLDGIAEGVRLAVSAGVAVGEPAAIMEIWAAADASLYEAKAAGGRAVRVAPRDPA